MTHWSSTARANLADELEAAATADAAAAAEGRQTADDPAKPAHERGVAARAADTLNARAAGLRSDAAAIRGGADPHDAGYTDPRLYC